MATMCLPYDGLTKLSILGKEERQEQIYSLFVCLSTVHIQWKKE